MDTTVRAWLKETGRKDFTRKKVFGIGIGKKIPIMDASQLNKDDRKQYEAWKKQKEDIIVAQTEAKFRAEELAKQFEGFDEIVTNIVNTPSNRELANRKLLEQIQRINEIDLSIDTSNYIGDNEIESKYPNLVESIFAQVSSYGNEFREEEKYAQVVVTNTINSKDEILEHIRWMILKPNSSLDVELRNAENMGAWVLQTTSDVGLGVGVKSTNTNLSVKKVEEPKPPRPRPILPQLQIPIRQIQKDATVIASSKLIPYDEKLLTSLGRSTNTRSNINIL